MKRTHIFFLVAALALTPVLYPAFAPASWTVSHVNAVSANVTLRPLGREFECDTTQRTATLSNVRGGSIYNKSSDSVWVDLNGGTVVTSSGSTSIEVAQGTALRLPVECTSFTFKTASGTSYLIFVGP